MELENKKNVVLLGSTGSIGVQALDVIRQQGYTVLALAACRSAEQLEQQIREFRPAYAALYDESAAADLRVRVADLPVKVLPGMEGLCVLAGLPEADVVLNAVGGMVGLRPTLAAVAAGHDVALANKETLVTGGALVTKAVAEKGVRLLPVDSEHSAIFQCLQASPSPKAVRRLILTASGGPFFGKTSAELERVTRVDALKHPNWSMGAKITIDSATMVNKGLELIEAHWLFAMPPERIDVVVHRESVVHSLIEFEDSSVLAQLGVPDMRVPIQYALTYPDRAPSTVPHLDLASYGTLTFCEPDHQTFPAVELCREAIRKGGVYPTAFNGANEEAVALFLNDQIGFTDIVRCCEKALAQTLPREITLETIEETDRQSRALVRQFV